MEYSVLGKVEVRRNGDELDLGAFRQRALLAVLLSAPNTIFSTDRIIDALWGEDGDGDRQNSLWVYVSGLRKALEPDREKRQDPTILLTQSPGYVLAIEPDEVDAVRFERMVGEGRALAPTDPAAASMVFGEALSLWRGRAYEDFSYEPFIQTEIARLEALRQEAVEARIDADLERGMSRELLSELETLVRQHPLREEVAAQHMIALTRADRQADALRAYQALRARLGEELGIEPSRRLQELETRIVTGDIDTPMGEQTGRSSDASGLAVRGYELREKIGEGAFGEVYRAYQPAIGREVAVKVIREELANDADFIRRFEAEAQLVARLEHPHIVPLYDYWREPDAAYLVMRYVAGGTLASVLDERGLDREETARLVGQVGRALQTAHAAGIVHRDVRPDNILVDDEGNAYLTDFGIALDVAEAEHSIGLASLMPPYASPEAMQRQTISPRADIYSLGVVAAHALTGIRGEIEAIRGALDVSTMEVIDKATGPKASDRFGDVGAFVDAIDDVLGVESDATLAVEAENPYMGLRSFDSTNSDVFFGRERLVARLLARLGGSGSKSRFVAIVGPSGSGKSSVARAGLLPALRGDAVVGSANWFTVAITPGTHPFEELEAALQSIATTRHSSLLEELGTENGLHRVAQRILPDDGSQLLLLIDQFEELFTLADAETSDAFLDLLAAAATDDRGRVRIVTTLRADFYDRPLRHLAVGELLREGTEVITPMTPDELERAITGPLEPLGIRYEAGLVSELVRDVADRTGALPLLQYTLTELFDSRTGNVITNEAYESLGGVSGALIERAEGLFARLGDHAHGAVRQLFLRLVTFGEGVEDTRRRVLRTELEQLDVDRQVLDGVLDTFGRHRLLSFDRDPVTRGPTVEISHEALLREWLRLRNWIDGAREGVRNQRRLADAMREWASAGREPAYLLTAGRLGELERWADGTDVALSRPEQEYLDASIAERDRLAAEELERQERTVQAEQVAQKRNRQLAISGVVGLVVAALAVFGISQWRTASTARDEVAAERDLATRARDEATAARDEATQARSDRDSLVTAAEYVTAAETSYNDDPALSVLYAIEAIRATSGLGFATEEAVDSMHWGLQRLGVQFEVGEDPEVTARSGPHGLTGVFLLSPAELVDIAEDVIDRRLVDAECVAVTGDVCAPAIAVLDDLPLRFGMENYEDSFPSVIPGDDTGVLSGTRVSLAVSSVVGGTAGLDAELARFSDLTGINVDVVGEDGVDITVALGDGVVVTPPDVSVVYTPQVPEWAQDRVVDLSHVLDTEQYREDFGEYLTELTTFDTPNGPEHWLVPFNIGPKGVIFYAKPAFEEAGYELPETFDELVELSEEIAATGMTPWCFEWGSTFATAWPGTDLLETMLIRTAGVDAFDRWVAGDLDFASPEVIEAAKQAERLLFTPGFVNGGTESIASTDWLTVLLDLLDVHSFTGVSGPQCMFAHQQFSIMNFLGPNTPVRAPGVLGRDIGVFLMPPMEADAGPVSTGGGSLAFASSDRPEVRVFMSFIAGRSWGETWAGAEADGSEPFISSNQRFETYTYGTASDGRSRPRQFRIDAATRVDIHEAHQAALAAGTWRFDADNQMEPGFATWLDGPRPGPFWQAMADWVNEVKPIEEILADLDEERAKYRS